MKFTNWEKKIEKRNTVKTRLSTPRIIALGFLGIILLGTFLLMLPIATKSGSTSFIEALFTATSATCVTGLVVVDTYTHWTLFGQIIILCMIQIGGLGFMTVAVVFFFMARKNIGLWGRDLLSESLNAFQIGGVVSLTKRLLKRTLIFEGVGAALLMVRFIPQYGIARGVYFGIFHSISAFCNAGFDLMGINEAFSSLSAYASDLYINIVVICLVTIGGLGFLVWDDLAINKWKIKKYRLHTKIVLVTSAVLLFGGAIIFYLLECNHLMADMNAKEAVLASMFSSMTARTAGFNTIDTGALTDTSKFFNAFLMLIGGSPGSTAGGVKTTSLAVIAIYAFSSWSGNSEIGVAGRRLSDDVLKKACLVFANNLLLSVIASIILGALQPIPMMDIMTETFSAVGTVGMSTGITRQLCMASKLVLILMMYCGRIGSLTFAMMFMQKKKLPPVQKPVEKILIG